MFLADEHRFAWELQLSLAEKLDVAICDILTEKESKFFQIDLDPHHRSVTITMSHGYKIPNKKERKQIFNLGFKRVVVTHVDWDKERFYHVEDG